MSLRRYLTARRCFIFCFTMLFLILIVYLFQFTSENEATNPSHCEADPKVHSNLLHLAAIADEILTKENITHFLCYGTLWGVLRRGDLLPWKRDFDFCVSNQELLWRIDEGYLRRLFRLRGVDMEYSNADGVYSTWIEKNGKENGILRMYVFDKFESRMRRIGIKNRFIPYPVSGEGADTFPAQLVARPLSKKKLKNLMLPVPREGAEIQKYHYIQNWWVEVKPNGCK